MSGLLKRRFCIVGLGLLGVWLAMIADWVVRAVFFLARYRQGKWKRIKVIG